MGKMFKIEMDRVRNGKIFWISLIAGSVILILQILFETVKLASNPLASFLGGTSYPFSLYMRWAGVRYNAYMYAYLLVFPILAASSHAITYYIDYKGGYIKNLVTRGRKKDYLLAKYFATFISGGLVVVIPMVVNFLLTSSMLPAIKPFVGVGFIHAKMFLAPLAYYHPFIYFIIFMLIYFVYGGAFACITLAGSYFIRNVFLLTLSPFIIWYSLGFISIYVKNIQWVLSISPARMLNMSSSYTTLFSIVSEAVFLIILGFIVYYWKGMKDDII